MFSYTMFRGKIIIVSHLVLESLRMAAGELRGNLLRTVLSLLGITIGVFIIIAISITVESLEFHVKESFDFLGSDNLTVEKWPFTFEREYPWWKYYQRPVPKYREFEYLRDHVSHAAGITFIVIRGGISARREGKISRNATLVGTTYGHKHLYDMPIRAGRFFRPLEAENGIAVVILGHRISEDLFPHSDPVGRKIKIKGSVCRLVGVIESEGKSFLGTPTSDTKIYIPAKAFGKILDLGSGGQMYQLIMAKGKGGEEGLEKLKWELRDYMRRVRGLKPRQDDNFSLNRPDQIREEIGKNFQILQLAGWVISSFAILIGGFNIANIMYVSVRERTRLIGIQKAMGAKKYFILIQYLCEAVFLAILGGVAGLLLVYLGSLIPIEGFDVFMRFSSMIAGVGLSAFIGILSGLLPAISASRMEPVDAMRS